jgi:uncharacterized repeat protein (TIGR02543 family)
VVSKAGITDLALNGTDTFTVAPKAGLPAGSYTGTITVGGGNIPSAGFDVSFTVAAASYGISLSETGTYTFPAAFAGYGAPALAERIKSISVTNTGNQATGALTIAKSEPNNATNFTVSETGIESIPNGGTGGFTVVPNAALPARAAAYTATITVSGGNSITASFIVSFTVNASGATPYAIELDGVTGGIHTFLAAIEGYGAQTAKSVTVRNTGSAATEALDIAISGTDANDFVVSLVGPAAIADIGISASDSFTVFPRTGLIYVLGKTYEATITVSSATHTAINEQFEVKFEVIEPYYEVSLNQTGTYLFPPAYPNYGQQRALTVTVANEGNLPTGTLDITISSAYPGYFTAPDTLDSIAVHGTGRFTVAPITGHPLGGPYDATIEVSSVAHPTISEQFDVRFTVTTAPVISLGETGYDFPAVTVGYGAAPPAKTVTVTNTGDKDTGALTIRKTGANPGSFAVSKNSIATPGIEVGQNDSFTVVPITGLSAKDTPYTATITVGGEGIITQTFDVSFTVKPVYHTVTFSAPGSMPTISTAQAIHNSTVNSLPSDPGRNGYTFAGWYTTPETGGSKFTTATRVSAPITVYARWLSSNAGLAALSVSQGELDPAFASYITNYSVTVPNTVASINVSATPADGKARYERYPSGNSVSLNAGLNVITVKVIAEDGTTSTDYTIAVTREQPLSANANLSSLGVSVGMLSPAFSPNITAYTVTVPTATSAITVSAAAADAWNVATIAQSPGNALGDPVDLESPSTAIAITVTAANGDAKAYTITVKKEAGNNAVNVFIGITDKYIDLARDTENDLSQALNNSLSLTAPDGYQNYAWLVDGNSTGNNTQNIVLNHGGRSLGTHSVLLTFEDAGGAKYGCEVLFRVAR